MKPTSFVVAALLSGALVLLRRRLGGTLLAIGVLVVAWLVVRGTGVVHLPDLVATAKKVGPTLGAWTYVLVGAMAFLETAFFVGLVAPGEVSVVLGGFVAGQGRINVFVLVAIVVVCAAAGDTVSFFLGRRLGRGFLLRHGGMFGITKERLDRVEQFFAAHGGKTILLGRFLGLVRALAPFVAGASKMPARRFLPIDYVAAALWSVTFVTLGYVFWRSFDKVVSIAKKGSLVFGALVFLIVLGFAAFRWLEVPANRQRLRRAWRERSPKSLTQRR
jgi:membrane protein DedA with SNARE-associated domain